MKNLVYLIFMTGLAATIAAPTIPNQETLDYIKQEGQLFSVRISRGEPVRIFVVGKEEAKIDLSKLTITVRRIKPYPGKILNVDRHGDYFQVSEVSEYNTTTDLEISTKVENKDEVFKFKLKKNKP